MKPNKQRWNIAIGMIMIGIAVIVLTISTEKDIKRLEKYDTCLTQAITVNPDPNDTTERTLLLENCMNQ